MNQIKFHKLSVEESLRQLNTSHSGLSADEAAQRLKQYGYNELKEKPKEPAWKLLLSQFNDILIYILIASAIISIILGKTIEPIAIIVIVILAAVTGFIQEYQAEKAIESLRKMTSPTARVIRNGETIEIPAKELVPGDIILLTAGDKVPADARIIEQKLLKVEESALTGESVAVEKHADAIDADNISLGDKKNLLFMGTSIVYGRAEAVVIDTGMNTEFGKIAQMIDETQTEKTPLQKNLNKLGKQLGIFSIALATVVSVLELFRGQPLIDVFVWGVALAVAIIPEALPAVVTITLALGVKRMVRRNALIRKLPAVETLGATNIICSDKTGTLTQDKMTIKKIYVFDKIIDVTGDGYIPSGKFLYKDDQIPNNDPQVYQLLLAGALCNDAKLLNNDDKWSIIGDPTEAAIVVAAQKYGIDTSSIQSQYKRINEIPFSSETKKMTTVNQVNGQIIAFSKGAPEVILSQCSYVFDGQKNIELTEQLKQKILETYNSLAENALRSIAISQKIIQSDADNIETQQVFLGMTSMIDPPRVEVKPAIKKCETAGIKPIMITGDYKVTAVAIARELGILKNGKALTGSEVETMTDEQLEAVIDDVEVFARISPIHKRKIVDTLIKRNNIVAMTGDGVNDAPSLKRADIGIAMGSGTDVSKEASDMILLDDNFATIVAAVEEGRSIFENIRKYLVYLLSGNIGTVIGLVIALLLGFVAPLSAVHILFINFVMDGILAITLGVEPPEKDIMNHKPRPKNQNILNTKSVAYIATIGLWIGLVCFSIFALYASTPSNTSIFDRIILAFDNNFATDNKQIPMAMTMFYVSLIMSRIFNVFATRSLNNSFFSYGIFGNRTLFLGVVVTIILSFLTVSWLPLAKIFSNVNISPADWFVAIGGGFSVLVISEIFKLVYRKK